MEHLGEELCEATGAVVGEERACATRLGAIRTPRGALTVGALFGYSSVNSTESLKVPSSHAVSSGLVIRGGVSGLCAATGQERAAKQSRRLDEIGQAWGLRWASCGWEVGKHPKMTACHFMMSLS